MKDYTKTQILKHALQYYLTRPDATQEDLDRERRLLSELEDDIERMKERYHIGEV